MSAHVRPRLTRGLVLACMTSLVAAPLAAQQDAAKGDWSPREVLAKESYVRPPADIERLVTAPRQNNVSLTNQSPDRKHFLKLVADGLPTVQTFGKPHYYFAGLQVDYKANRARALTTRGSDGIDIIDATTGKALAVELPKGATASSPIWSPDGSRLAYIANFDDASRVYVADVATGKSRALAASPLLATLVTDIDWTGDGKSIVTVLVPDGRKAPPVRPAIETGPLVRMTDGHKDKTRVYASLLRDPYEKELMEYYVSGQLATIDAKSGAVKKIGAPALIFAVDPSPDGQWFHVTVMQKPFSYIVQYAAFGQSEEVWDATGKKVAELASRPVRESDVDDPNVTGQVNGRTPSDSSRRAFGWMPNGQGLYFLRQDPAPPRGASAADTGESRPGAARRKDHLYQWPAPFASGGEKSLLESDNRIASVLFSDDASVVFAAENANGTGTVYATYLNEPTKKHTLWRLRGINASVGPRSALDAFLASRGGNGDDSATFYQNPGAIVQKRGKLGGRVAMLSSDGQSAFLIGTHYYRDWQAQAPRGFVDRIEIKTAKKTPMFEGAADTFETVNAPLDDDFSKAVVVRETAKTVPDTYLRDASGTVTKLTSNKDYSPEFTNLQRRRVWVTRADGSRFLVDLTLPANYRDGTRLPAMFWFYPFEYTDTLGYQRTLRTENINAFPQAGPRTIEFLAMQGYAVANFNPPIIGGPGHMNDNYVADLRNNLSAVIDELDRLGYIDRTRIGIGGHSYGAFSTVNALVNTPFFKAGIAGDGMYNRSLTPNGFQNERRDFWEGQKTYLEMSPFLQADKLTGALLMYHSIEDQNVGTAPISSERMMHALQGLGKTAALYMYPYEDHGPATKETLLDQWARWTAWLDLYVKNPQKPAGPKVASN